MYIYMHNANTQSKVQESKSDITYIQEVWPKECTGKLKIRHCHILRMWPKHSTEKESPNLERYRHNSKEKAKREKERGPYKEAKPYNLLIIALLGLPFLLAF